MPTAQASNLPYINTGSFGIACVAMEALTRQLAKEFGAKGVRVICLRSSGSPDAKGVDEVFTIHAKIREYHGRNLKINLRKEQC